MLANRVSSTKEENREMNTKQKSIIILCQGGAGDVLAHTPMIRYFRKAYPEDKIIVLSTYKQLLEHNPNIDELISLKEVDDFYSEYVHMQDVRFFKKHFVYDAIMDEPANGTTSLPEFICKVYGAEYDKQPLDYFVQPKEIRKAKTFLSQYKINKNLPIILLHCTGAIPSDGQMSKTNNLKDLNIKIVDEFVSNNLDKAWFIQIGLEGEPVVGHYVNGPDGVKFIPSAVNALGMPMREAIAIINECDSFIFIESLFAHCSNALKKRGIVVFQNMSPDFFGYSQNLNIHHKCDCEIWPCNRPVGALLDLLPGYRNPKTRQALLWECQNQVCAQITVEELQTNFNSLLEEITSKNGSTSLEEVRALPSPKTSKRVLENPNVGAVAAGDINLIPHGVDNGSVEDSEQSEKS